MADQPKPQCGSEKQDEGYDLGLHVLGCGFPVAAKKIRWMKIPPKIFFACKHFGTGVLIATAFVHVSLNLESPLNHKLLPTAFESLGDPCLPDLFTEKYPPLPGVIMMASMFCLFVIEMVLNAKTGGHSHGGPTGADITVNDKASEVTSSTAQAADSPPSEAMFVNEDGKEMTEAEFKKMSTNISLLEGGILFHSIFVGMTVSITVDGFVVLLIAILFHQMFEGLGLGSRIAAVPYPKRSIRPWLLVVAFGTTAPIGQAIGLVSRNSYDEKSALGLIIVGVFNAISSGLLLYAALVDLLAEDFLSDEANHLMDGKKKAIAFCWVLFGAAGMSVVGIFA
ncbi:hypothetical protein L249_1112 [Ophiocordyceps polyrhachis-furcata BCC 54312]|uniref:ZIP Zinc transporter n=1 Tax=Ophiocordyceps polyrhachis-furcata BCC 54312 TaxID=1330021 RepID=A0A367LF77_9HYPO|nr:hypothetical protein L249_1112 [Ophiocordyceps polyrhachis-furcata BCC 54312]